MFYSDKRYHVAKYDHVWDPLAFTIGKNKVTLNRAHSSCHLPYSWGKPRKTSARRLSDEGAVQPVIEKGGKKERTGRMSLSKEVLELILANTYNFWCFNHQAHWNTVLKYTQDMTKSRYVKEPEVRKNGPPTKILLGLFLS